MIQTEKLARLGILYDEGVARFAGHQELYEKYLFRFPQDPTFAQLKEAMEKEDYEAALLHAHTLKGVTGNLSLDHLYQELVPLVEQLRDGLDIPGAKAAFPAFRQEYEATMEALLKLAAENEDV